METHSEKVRESIRIEFRRELPTLALSPVVARDKGSLSVVGPVQIVEIAFNFQELGQTFRRALGLADENVCDRSTLNRALPKATKN